MSLGASVKYIRVAPTDEARLTSWVHHVARLTGAPAEPLPEQPVVLWQLVAKNHRVLARGSGARASREEAEADVASVVAARSELVPRMVRLESNRGYGWLMLRDGEVVVTCARWYAMERNRRESLSNARLGLELLAGTGSLALVADGMDERG